MQIFDAHFHVINPDYPLVENDGYLPPTFTIADYKARLSNLHLIGGAVVSGSFQAFDQEYLLDALNRLGDNFFGVANIPFTMSDAELNKLNQAGVRAVRFNLKRGGSEKVAYLEQLSHKLYNELGWHTELYLDSKDIPELTPTLNKLPPFSIDHLGLSKTGLDALYKLAEKGNKIKATGFGRIDFDPIPVMKKIYNINPESLLFGTDLPSTRAKTPFSEKDISIILENFSEAEQEHIFYKNALKWYQKNS